VREPIAGVVAPPAVTGVIDPGLVFSVVVKLQYSRFVTACLPLTRNVPVTLRFCTVGASNRTSDIFFVLFFFGFFAGGVFLKALSLRKKNSLDFRLYKF
jgi:hypothetical protein